MKKHQLVSVLMVAVLGLLQGSAFAQQRHGNNGNGNSNHCGNGDRACQREQGRYQNRDDHQRGEQGSYRADGERGAGPAHDYYRGDRLPNDYRTRQYVVDDWRGHGLHSPPRGYHWVQTGGDYVLVAITTGIILELLLNR